MQTKIGIACLSWLLAFSTMMLGQAPTATLVGQVVDPTKANVSGATITVRNTATNETRTVKTNSAGQYTGSNLSPGLYEVTISPGVFHPLQRETHRICQDKAHRT